VSQEAIEEEDSPPAWDEYDQMINQVASAISAAPKAAKDSVAVTPNNVQATPAAAPKIAPPWDTSPIKRQELAESATNAQPSASITDLLFADDPEDIVEDLVLEEIEPPAQASLKSQATTKAPNKIKQPSTPLLVSGNADEWYRTIEALEITGLAAELAKNCILDHEDAEKVELHLDVSSEMLMTNAAITEIEQALNKHFDHQKKLVVAIRELTVETPAQYNLRRLNEVQLGAEHYIENDSFVKQLSSRFSARVVPGSVKPKT